MKFFEGPGLQGVEERLVKNGISRRDFIKFCAAVSAAMGLGPSFAPKVAEAITAKKRPSVVYLHNAECTGCSESVLRTVKPFIDELVLDVISLDYHETIMAAAGEAAEEALHKAISSPDGFVCVVEGATPTIEGGKWGMVAGKPMLETLLEVAPKAKAVIAIGTCATFGGVQKAKPNPSQAMSVQETLDKYHKGNKIQVINIAGCPPNPINFVGTVVHLLTKGMPKLDTNGRPAMFFGETVHDKCPRLKFFEKDMFAKSFGDETARKGYCLYELGCKGPLTYNNCPTVLFNDTNWPVQAGHPCIGCSEPDFWDEMSPFYKQA